MEKNVLQMAFCDSNVAVPPFSCKQGVFIFLVCFDSKHHGQVLDACTNLLKVFKLSHLKNWEITTQWLESNIQHVY